jgi:hypothetical protein
MRYSLSHCGKRSNVQFPKWRVVVFPPLRRSLVFIGAIGIACADSTRPDVPNAAAVVASASVTLVGDSVVATGRVTPPDALLIISSEDGLLQATGKGSARAVAEAPASRLARLLRVRFEARNDLGSDQRSDSVEVPADFHPEMRFVGLEEVQAGRADTLTFVVEDDVGLVGSVEFTIDVNSADWTPVSRSFDVDGKTSDTLLVETGAMREGRTALVQAKLQDRLGYWSETYHVRVIDSTLTTFSTAKFDGSLNENLEVELTETETGHVHAFTVRQDTTLNLRNGGYFSRFRDPDDHPMFQFRKGGVLDRVLSDETEVGFQVGAQYDRDLEIRVVQGTLSAPFIIQGLSRVPNPGGAVVTSAPAPSWNVEVGVIYDSISGLPAASLDSGERAAIEAWKSELASLLDPIVLGFDALPRMSFTPVDENNLEHFVARVDSITGNLVAAPHTYLISRQSGPDLGSVRFGDFGNAWIVSGETSIDLRGGGEFSQQLLWKNVPWLGFIGRVDAEADVCSVRNTYVRPGCDPNTPTGLTTSMSREDELLYQVIFGIGHGSMRAGFGTTSGPYRFPASMLEGN